MIKVAVVGSGYWGKNLVRNFHSLGALGAICDKDPKVLGVTYCACMYDQGGNTLKKNNQNGYYDLQGNPREKLIADVTEINKEVYTHSLTPANPEELDALDKILYDTWAKYLVGNTLWRVDKK